MNQFDDNAQNTVHKYVNVVSFKHKCLISRMNEKMFEIIELNVNE